MLWANVVKAFEQNRDIWSWVGVGFTFYRWRPGLMGDEERFRQSDRWHSQDGAPYGQVEAFYHQ